MTQHDHGSMPVVFDFREPDEEFVREGVCFTDGGTECLELHHPGGDAAPVILRSIDEFPLTDLDAFRRLLRNQDEANRRVKAAEGRRVGRIIRKVRDRESR